MDQKFWVLLDTETTGFKSPIYVVELGAQKMRGWAPDGPPFRRVLNHNTDIAPEISRVNGYTREILERDGEFPHTVYSEFSDYADGLPLVAYNLSYDLDKVLMPEWRRLNIKPIGEEGFCALRLAQRLLDPVPAGNCKLQTLRQYYRLPERGAHTALGDVETVADLLLQVLRPLAEQGGLLSWDEIVAYTMAPWFPSRIAFGKYKGRRFTEARNDQALYAWLEWLASSTNGRSAEMGLWYLQQLTKERTSPFSELLVDAGVLSESSEIVIYLAPELATLRRLISDARARLADLEAEYTQERHRVEVVESELFALLRPLYERRDQLQLVIHYRRSYIGTLLDSGEEDAEAIKSEYENARSETEREYEKVAAQAAEKESLTNEEELELKTLFRKLVRLYHPDRFGQDPEKQAIYARLTSEINEARDRCDIARLRQIANDPEGYLLQHGLGSLDFEDGAEISKLSELYESLQLRIFSLLEALAALQESSGYELYLLNGERPGYVEELAAQQAKDLCTIISDLEVEARQLAEEIENLTGSDDCIGS